MSVKNFKAHPQSGMVYKMYFLQDTYDLTDFEKLLDIYLLDISFLNSYYQRLRLYLIEIFLVNEDDCECYLNVDYEYRAGLVIGQKVGNGIFHERTKFDSKII